MEHEDPELRVSKLRWTVFLQVVTSEEIASVSTTREVALQKPVALSRIRRVCGEAKSV